MTLGKIAKLSGLIFAIQTLCGCASIPRDVPATISMADVATSQRVVATIRSAMGNQRVTLGPAASEPATNITVLPPPLGPYESRSLATPEIFDIIKRGNACFLVQRSSNVAYALENVRCRAATKRK